jgi:murein L,D-transpeptidase YafK
MRLSRKLWYIVSTCAAMNFFALFALAQENENNDFKNYQLSCYRVSEACKKYNDTLSKEFRKRNLVYPPKDIYLRAFKSQNEMELWARNNESSEYKLIKTYHICAISGALGPKRSQGDRQVPEGFYFIEEFNPKSDYYLAMLLNYPNYSDKLKGKGNLGGDIYIHGGCVTIGCMPMTDDGIKEIYTICLNAKMNGQEYIPVHIFPTRLTKNGMNYLKSEFPHDAERQQFWADLKAGYDYFEKYHKLLPVMYSTDGRYAN